MPASRVVIKKPRTSFKDLSDEDENVTIVGLAYDKAHRIEVDPNQSNKEIFLTSYHEFMHITLPDLTERQIIKLEGTIGVALWKVVCKLRRKWDAKLKRKYRK